MNGLRSEVRTPYFLELAARKYPEREFLICEQSRRTYKQVDERVNALANAEAFHGGWFHTADMETFDDSEG